MKKKISILLADDNKYMLNSLSSYIREEKDIEVISEVENGKDAIELIEKGYSDVVVLDLSMPMVDGFEVLRHLKVQNIKTPVLIFTNYNEENQIIMIKRLGASGYICKTESPDKLVSAIRTVAEGKKYFLS